MTRSRFEKIGEDVEEVSSTEEKVEEAETIGSDVEVVEDSVEVIRGPGAKSERYTTGDVLELAEKQHPLPSSIDAIARFARRFAVYGTCLVELRDRLRRQGLLDDEWRRLIDKELRYVRVWLYILALKAIRVMEEQGLEKQAACKALRSRDRVLGELCRVVLGRGVPKYVERELARGNPGSDNPAAILAMLRRHHPQCYNAIVNRRYEELQPETRSVITS